MRRTLKNLNPTWVLVALRLVLTPILGTALVLDPPKRVQVAEGVYVFMTPPYGDVGLDGAAGNAQRCEGNDGERDDGAAQVEAHGGSPLRGDDGTRSWAVPLCPALSTPRDA